MHKIEKYDRYIFTCHFWEIKGSTDAKKTLFAKIARRGGKANAHYRVSRISCSRSDEKDGVPIRSLREHHCLIKVFGFCAKSANTFPGSHDLAYTAVRKACIAARSPIFSACAVPSHASLLTYHDSPIIPDFFALRHDTSSKWLFTPPFTPSEPSWRVHAPSVLPLDPPLPIMSVPRSFAFFSDIATYFL